MDRALVSQPLAPMEEKEGNFFVAYWFLHTLKVTQAHVFHAFFFLAQLPQVVKKAMYGCVLWGQTDKSE